MAWALPKIFADPLRTTKIRNASPLFMIVKTEVNQCAIIPWAASPIGSPLMVRS